MHSKNLGEHHPSGSSKSWGLGLSARRHAMCAPPAARKSIDRSMANGDRPALGDHAGRVGELKNKVATRRDLSPRFGDRLETGRTVGAPV